MDTVPGYRQGADFEFRTLTPKELRIVQENLTGWAQVFRLAETFCTVCRFPLKPQVNYRVAFVGDVCGLCWDMYAAVHSRAWFVSAHTEWEQENKRRAKRKGQLGSDGDYLSKD